MILQDSLDSLFTSSLLFEQQSLTELITALGQLTVNVLDNKTKGASSKTETEVLANINTFGITRLVETALVNISRIEMIWKVLVSSHFAYDYRLRTSKCSRIARCRHSDRCPWRPCFA